MQANWFPTYTLGEDMALALEVQKAGWKGAYVKVSPHLKRSYNIRLHALVLEQCECYTRKTLCMKRDRRAMQAPAAGDVFALRNPKMAGTV